MAFSPSIRIILLAVMWTHVNCTPVSLAGHQVDLQRDELPEDPAALVQIADAKWAEGRSITLLARGAAAVERAHRISPSFETHWRLSRFQASISEGLEQRHLRSRFIKAALEHAKEAVALEPQRPEGYGTLAVARGFQARNMLAPGRSTQQQIEEAAEALYDNHPTYDEGLGHRVLGGLYTQAPPWPAGVGDLEGAIEILQENLERFPRSALTHFFLGEAYLKFGRTTQAKKSFLKVLAAARTGEWAIVGASYRSKARRYLSSIREGGNP